ncbi:hypothetical protein Pla110_28710 [Polystyrenella longa]|uniref:Uncharacterized protein n=1 Tax=Polystyrenella longa TaxID=2528007 RepID=A0A518CPL2_9PLAN|nr:hypothetical protein [Polystyrenella longa]QDU81134.1 hypothetical protein Pla110_28710 [Polystyrenella longa]
MNRIVISLFSLSLVMFAFSEAVLADDSLANDLQIKVDNSPVALDGSQFFRFHKGESENEVEITFEKSRKKMTGTRIVFEKKGEDPMVITTGKKGIHVVSSGSTIQAVAITIKPVKSGTALTIEKLQGVIATTPASQFISPSKD